MITEQRLVIGNIDDTKPGRAIVQCVGGGPPERAVRDPHPGDTIAG
jgi:hypothetical protein